MKYVNKSNTKPPPAGRKLKQRLKAEGNETVTSCHTLKMSATNLRLMRLFYEAWSDLFNSSAAGTKIE